MNFFRNNTHIVLFTVFSIGLPIWGMSSNDYDGTDVHNCSGECYQRWREDTGGVLAIAEAKAAAKAEASPIESGELAYAGCVACHGSKGEGGIGPMLAGQPAAQVAEKLARYKSGETIGRQSSLMWSQASLLSDTDISNLSVFIESL